MGATRSTVEENARYLINDLDANYYAVSVPRMHKIVESEMQDLASKLDMGPTWTTDAVTYVDGTKDYEIPTSTNTIEYQRILIVKRNSDGRELVRLPLEDINQMYEGTSDSSFEGDPLYYALWEDFETDTDEDPTVASLRYNMRVYPTPGSDEASETQDHLLARIPAALSASTSFLPFSESMTRAFEKNLASVVFRMMTQDERERRKISQDIVGKWDQDYATAIAKERIRMNRAKRLSHIQLKVGT